MLLKKVESILCFTTSCQIRNTFQLIIFLELSLIQIKIFLNNNILNQIQDNPMIRNRVMLSLSLLFGAKIMNVTVPFLFKYAVDNVNEMTTTSGEMLLGMATVPQALSTTAVCLLLGCKLVNNPCSIFIYLLDVRQAA